MVSTNARCSSVRVWIVIALSVGRLLRHRSYWHSANKVWGVLHPAGAAIPWGMATSSEALAQRRAARERAETRTIAIPLPRRGILAALERIVLATLAAII